MTGHTSQGPSLPSSRVMLRGIRGFILFSTLGLLMGLWWKEAADLRALPSYVQWRFAAILIPLIASDYLLGGLRYRMLFDGKTLPYVSLWDCMRSNWANIFMGTATPFQTGGGPAQLYILWRCGARISDGVLASLINFAATLAFFLIASIAAELLLPPDLFGNNFAPILRTGFAVVGAVAASVLMALVFPNAGKTLVRRLSGLLPIRNTKFLAFREHLLNVLEAETDRFREASHGILRRRRWLLGAIVLATTALFFNKYFMGYVIARALGQEAPFGIFLGLQILQLFLIYFAPTPGASGVAELSSVWLMGQVMPEAVLLIYAVAWRFATTIVGAAIGGLVLFLDLRQWARVSVQPALAETASVSSRHDTSFTEKPH